jgi:phosphomannomutase/phosphoglucomutase
VPKDSSEIADAVTTPRSESKQSGSDGVWNHALVAVIVSTIGLATATLILLWQLVISANEAHQQQQAKVLNDVYVAFYNTKIDEMKALVNAAATAQATVDALTSANSATIRQRAAMMTDQISYAERVDIIRLGEAQVDLDDETPISYAMLDLIKRAEAQEFAGPEIAKAHSTVVYAAQPILHNGVPEGVLFVAFDANEFLRDAAARSIDATIGEGAILQTLDSGADDPRVFSLGSSGGGEGAGGRERVITTPLNARNWQLQFTFNPAKIGEIASSYDLLTAIAVALGFVLAGISLAFSGLSRKLRNDSDQLASYASSLIRGRSAQLERYTLPLFQQLAAGLAPLTRAGAKDPASSRSGSSSAPAAKARPNKAPDAGTPEDLLDDTEEFLDVNVSEDADENFGIEVSEEVTPADLGLNLDETIFRAYDIRGITTRNLTEDVVYWIGRAFAAESSELEQNRVAVGRDGRHSSIKLRDALIRGLTEGGVDVIDVGQVPTPLLYFATHALDTGTGVMITGSHNPPDYNGLKMMIGGVTLAEDRIQALKLRLQENRLSEGQGDVEEIDFNDHYLDRVLEDVVVAQPLKVVVDCGNGVAGNLAPRILEELGCDVVPLYCDIDGDFPNHHPDPAEPDNLKDLITVVADEKADLGLAFDGDGDRLGVVTASGEIIWPDKLLMLFAQDIVGRNPGADIIYDVKCSRHLNNLISDYGGRPIMWRTGHSHMKAKLKETGALLAGEFSGHICFGERWYGFDDALYSAARLLEILGSQSQSADEVFSQFPVTYATPELKIDTTEARKFEVVDQLAKDGEFGDGTITSIDGVRVDFSDGFGLLRASNTSPVLSLRFEADAQSALDRIQKVFQDQLRKIDPELRFL